MSVINSLKNRWFINCLIVLIISGSILKYMSLKVYALDFSPENFDIFWNDPNCSKIAWTTASGATIQSVSPPGFARFASNAGAQRQNNIIWRRDQESNLDFRYMTKNSSGVTVSVISNNYRYYQTIDGVEYGYVGSSLPNTITYVEPSIIVNSNALDQGVRTIISNQGSNIFYPVNIGGGDNTQLQETYDSMINLNENDYTPDSWNDLQMALDVAYSVLNNESSQETIDNALLNLTNKYNALVSRADFSRLEQCINELNNMEINENDYTPETYTAFTSIYNTALSIFNNKNSNQTDIDDILNDLNNAYNNLVTIVVVQNDVVRLEYQPQDLVNSYTDFPYYIGSMEWTGASNNPVSDRMSIYGASESMHSFLLVTRTEDDKLTTKLVVYKKITDSGNFGGVYHYLNRDVAMGNYVNVADTYYCLSRTMRDCETVAQHNMQVYYVDYASLGDWQNIAYQDGIFDTDWNYWNTSIEPDPDPEPDPEPGTGGLDQETKDMFERYLKRQDIFLSIIMFAVVLTFVRQVLHQASRNIRGL